MKARTYLLVFFFALFFAQPACAQSVKIRVINVKDGRALGKQPVKFNLIYEATQKRPVNAELNLRLATTDTGEVSFPLPDPVPAHLWVQVDFSQPRWRCACYVLTTTQEVLDKGLILLGDWKMPPSVDVHPGAGEILFTARPPTFFERLLDPLMRE